MIVQNLVSKYIFMNMTDRTVTTGQSSLLTPGFCRLHRVAKIIVQMKLIWGVKRALLIIMQ